MARVRATVEETELENDSGHLIPGLIVTCDECGVSVEVFGTSDASARRGAIMLREQCDGQNYYVVDEED
jgi:hypothetical protein